MIDKLEFLLALARERHFGRAAEACGVTQPTLSAGIKQLEDSLGLLLVNRSARFRGLTPEGERVLDWAKRIVGDTRAMRQEVRALKQGHLVGHLRIAVIPTALAMVSALTTPFRAKHPDIRFTILSNTSVEVLNALDNLEIDAGGNAGLHRRGARYSHRRAHRRPHGRAGGAEPRADGAGQRRLRRRGLQSRGGVGRRSGIVTAGGITLAACRPRPSLRAGAFPVPR